MLGPDGFLVKNCSYCCVNGPCLRLAPGYSCILCVYMFQSVIEKNEPHSQAPPSFLSLAVRFFVHAWGEPRNKARKIGHENSYTVRFKVSVVEWQCKNEASIHRTAKHFSIEGGRNHKRKCRIPCISSPCAFYWGKRGGGVFAGHYDNAVSIFFLVAATLYGRWEPVTCWAIKLLCVLVPV